MSHIQSFIIREGDEERRLRAVDFLRMMKLGRSVEVEIKEYRKNRSHAQNRLLWVFYGIIARELGYDPEELHEQMKVRVLGVVNKTVTTADGEIVDLVVPKSTTKLNVQEMTRFIEAVEVLASSLGIALPRPDIYDVAMGRKPE